MRPTLAVVVVTYDYGRFLGEALRSVLAQTDTFDEVVVVDDGSSDDSVQVARSFGDPVRVISQANAGQVAASLTGLRAVRSDYVLFLDADDLVEPGLVERVRPVLDRAPVKVQFPLRAVDEEGAPTGSVFPAFADGYDAAAMREDNIRLGFYTCTPTSGNVLRRETLLGLDWSVIDPRDALDGTLVMVLPYLGEVACLDEPLVRYRVHGSSTSQWGSPTPELLLAETDRFHRRWREACILLGQDRPPFTRTPAYLLERRLMTAALEGRRTGPGAVAGLLDRLGRAHLPRRQKLVLCGWVVAVALAPPRRARRLVLDRRSAAARPRLLRLLVRLTRTRRKPV